MLNVSDVQRRLVPAQGQPRDGNGRGRGFLGLRIALLFLCLLLCFCLLWYLVIFGITFALVSLSLPLENCFVFCLLRPAGCTEWNIPRSCHLAAL